mgnify:CR=1 FL=1
MKTITVKLLKWLREVDEKVKVYERLTDEPDSGKRIDYGKREG